VQDKFGRRYTLRVGTQNGGTLTITLPFTIEFDITRNTLTSANVCQIRIYNLSLKNRNQLRFNASDYGQFRRVELFAGYNDNPPKIFDGNVSQAWSVREGVNFITQIECYDGGFAFVNGASNTQFPAGVAQRDVILGLMTDLPNVTPGVVGCYPGTLSRGNTYSGNTTQILGELTGGGFFVDNGKANALGTNEYIAAVNGTTLINSQSGLLGTPVLEQTIVRFDMIFEPGLNAGHRITLDSITEANFNGSYKVTGVKHRGMISEAVCGSLITTGEFFYDKILTPVQ
jgi:hypothetical protein